MLYPIKYNPNRNPQPEQYIIQSNCIFLKEVPFYLIVLSMVEEAGFEPTVSRFANRLFFLIKLHSRIYNGSICPYIRVLHIHYHIFISQYVCAVNQSPGCSLVVLYDPLACICIVKLETLKILI